MATAISEAFWVGMFVVFASVFVGAFLKEVPLRRAHEFEGEMPAAAPAQAPATLSSAPTPVVGGSSSPTSRRALAYAAFGAALAFIAAVAAFLIKRNGS